MTGLSNRTKTIIQKMFPSEQQDDVEQFIIEECGNNLPFLQNSDEIGLERIRFAVLTVSNGDLNKLLSCIQLAQADWRDMLMAAGFGYDTTAHDLWANGYLAAS